MRSYLIMRTILILAATFILFATNAAAQVPCYQRDKLLTWLAAKYKEVPVAIGVHNKGGLVEVLSNEHGHSWTIILTSPEGLSCLVATGEGWRTQQQEEHAAEPHT